jgi:hypothetical protein
MVGGALSLQLRQDTSCEEPSWVGVRCFPIPIVRPCFWAPACHKHRNREEKFHMVSSPGIHASCLQTVTG